MDTLVNVIALIVAIAFKFLFFYVYTKYSEKKAPKKAEIFEVAHKGPETTDKAIKRVLVTGGCGFLGSAIVRQLEERLGHRVAIVVLDRAVHDKFGPLHPRVTYYRGDICTYTHVRSAAAGCACVVHTAAIVSDCISKDVDVQRVIEQGTKNVIEVCLEKDITSLVYTSSASVLFSKSTARPLGGGGSKVPILETASPLPAADLNGVYPRAKAVAERLVLAANSHLLHTVVLRPGGVYGTNDPLMICNILSGKPFMSPGNVVMPFVWVEDAARGHVDAVEQLLFPAPNAKRIHGRVYHLCHDPIRDPFLYREFMGGALDEATKAKAGAAGGGGPALKHASVKEAEAAAGVKDAPPPGINAYGLKVNPSVPGGFLRALSYVNHWVGRAFGTVLLHRSCTPENLLYVVNDWSCDVSDARSVLGWEPTPWRVVAARLGSEVGAENGASGKVKAA